MKKKSKVKFNKRTQDQLNSHVEVIEESVSEMAHQVSRAVANGLKGLPTCSSEKMLVNSFNCLKTLNLSHALYGTKQFLPFATPDPKE